MAAPRSPTARLQVMAPPVMVEDAEAAELQPRRQRRRQRDARDRGKRRGASARRGHAIGAEVGAAASASDATAAAAAVSASANAAASAAAAATAAAAVANELPHPLPTAPVPAALPGTQGGARTLGPYYGDLEGPGELERAVRLVSSEGELVLLHGNEFRLRMLVNLVAELNSHGARRPARATPPVQPAAPCSGGCHPTHPMPRAPQACTTRCFSASARRSATACACAAPSAARTRATCTRVRSPTARRRGGCAPTTARGCRSSTTW